MSIPTTGYYDLSWENVPSTASRSTTSSAGGLATSVGSQEPSSSVSDPPERQVGGGRGLGAAPALVSGPLAFGPLFNDGGRLRLAEAQFLENNLLRAIVPTIPTYGDCVSLYPGFDQSGARALDQTDVRVRQNFVESEFVQEAATRYVSIQQVDDQEMNEEVLGQSPIGRLKSMNFMEKVVGVRKLPQLNEYVVRFDDKREAEKAVEEISALRRWPVTFTSPAMYHNVPSLETPFWTPNESCVCMYIMGRDVNGWMESYALLQLPRLASDIRHMLTQKYGNVVESIRPSFSDGAMIGLKVSLWSVTMADRVVRDLVDGIWTFSSDSPFLNIILFVSYWEIRQDPLCFLAGISLRHRHPQNLNAGNVVSPESIRRGEDHRTTIMIRNIPNKLQWFELMRLITLVSFGQVTFSYLRVDFNNRCNVGYCFIDVLLPHDIIPIHNLLAGARWNVYNSDKVAQICYATIQGRDCLIERFRNSGVMTQWAPFRAKLYFNHDDDEVHHNPLLLGTIAPFSRSNNQVKLQRSLDNAYHIGLYPPNPRREGTMIRSHAETSQQHQQRGNRLENHRDNRDAPSRRPLTRGPWSNIRHPDESRAPSAPVPIHATIMPGRSRSIQILHNGHMLQANLSPSVLHSVSSYQQVVPPYQARSRLAPRVIPGVNAFAQPGNPFFIQRRR